MVALQPGLAFAHGEQILFFPIGILAAAIAVLGWSMFRPVGCGVRLLAVAVAFAASLPFWFTSIGDWPPVGGFEALMIFATGFIPSVVAGYLVLSWFERRAKRRG